MRIELVILLGVTSSAIWAAVCHLSYRCGFIEGALGARMGRGRDDEEPRRRAEADRLRGPCC